jgi:hypothetical protein
MQLDCGGRGRPATEWRLVIPELQQTDLKRIESELQELGYFTYIIKEQRDNAGESVRLENWLMVR